MENLVQADGTLLRRPVAVKLVGGPCDGQYANVLGFGTSCWQRIPGPTPFWARYIKNLHVRGEFVFDETAEIIGVVRMMAMIAAQGRGKVQGSYGA